MTDTCTRCGQTIGYDCGCTEIERLTADRDRYKARADHALVLVAAEREACASIAEECFAPGSEEEVAGEVIAASIRARTDDDAQAALERVKREARNEALREAFNTLRAYAPHHVDGPEHDVGYASGYATAQNRILALIEEDQSDE